MPARPLPSPHRRFRRRRPHPCAPAGPAPEPNRRLGQRVAARRPSHFCLSRAVRSQTKHAAWQGGHLAGGIELVPVPGKGGGLPRKRVGYIGADSILSLLTLLARLVRFPCSKQAHLNPPRHRLHDFTPLHALARGCLSLGWLPLAGACYSCSYLDQCVLLIGRPSYGALGTHNPSASASLRGPPGLRLTLGHAPSNRAPPKPSTTRRVPPVCVCRAPR